MLITQTSWFDVMGQAWLDHYMGAGANIFATHGFGKIAPWVDLANSQEWDGFGHLSDRLDDPRWLASFLRRWGFRRPAEGRPPITRLLRLRLLLRRIAERIGAQATL